MIRNLVLDFLTRHTKIRVPVSEIVEQFGGDLDETQRCVADLVDAGDLETWGFDAIESVCLTPLAAKRAGLRPSSNSARWLREGDRERSTRRKPAGTLATTDADIDPDSVADDRLCRPDQDVEATEEAEANPPVRRGDYLSRPLQMPSRIHGATAIWPLPGHRDDQGRLMPAQAVVGGRDEGKVDAYRGPCTACSGIAFDVFDYCVACLRSGQDHLIPKPTIIRTPKASKPKKAARFQPRTRKNKAS